MRLRDRVVHTKRPIKVFMKPEQDPTDLATWARMTYKNPRLGTYNDAQAWLTKGYHDAVKRLVSGMRSTI